MAESIDHIILVERMYKYVKSLIPIGNLILLFVDHPESTSKPSKVINGFVPDIYYCFNNLLIIGEGKTDNDVERGHSLMQYKSYLQEASLFNGQAIKIISVSWKTFSTAKNIFRNFKKTLNCENLKIIVLNNLGDECLL